MRFLRSAGTSPWVLILLGLGLSACNWVDSTGRQSNNTPTTVLNDGDTITDVEEASFAIDASADDDDGVVESYSWSDATEEGLLSYCDGEIDLSLAAERMADVCEDEDNCSVLFLADDTEDGVFQVLFPKLTAPIGVSHELAVRDNDGGQTTLTVHFCIDSINEAPLANADQYSVAEGTELVVSAEQGVLSNDSDDNDVRSTTLEVVGVQQPPAHASGFAMNADGSFTYNLSPFTPFNVTTDTFTYQITDGDKLATAEVTLDLSVIDEAPVQTGIVPAQSGQVGQAFGPLDLTGYITDPEGTALTFSASGLPDGITVSTAGIMSGTVTESGLSGAYTISVTASDGANTTSMTPFSLTLAPNGVPQLNSTLPDQEATVAVRIAFNTSIAFSDPDGDTLSFSATGLPEGVNIGSLGAVGGTPVVGSEGVYTVTVTATDGVDSVSGSFTMTVQANEAPTAQDINAIQTARIGQAYSLNTAALFSDPEAQELSFVAAGLPDSLTISTAGLISGTPTASEATGLTPLAVAVTATDPAQNNAVLNFQLLIF